MTTYYATMESPLDELTLVGDGQSLRGIFFKKHKGDPLNTSDWEYKPQVFQRAIQQLNEYFQGQRTEFDLELAPQGTEFQKKVWHELGRIPYGKTISYGELARRIDNPKAVRAVGLANGRNPLSIVVPCHRVIGADGKLTGYGGGLERKRTLLRLEASVR